MGVDKEPTTALQGGISHGKTVVGIWNLHVRITREDQQWFAQGFEIDNAACGTSQKDVKKKFQDGMAATIHEHLKLFGTIEGFLTPAPAVAWLELKKTPGKQHTYTQIGIHKLFPDQSVQDVFPFDGIEYRESELLYA